MMERLSDVARRVDGRLAGDDRPFQRVHTDSRTLARGDLFVALHGERFDGHTFLGEARRRRAAGALVAQEQSDGPPQVVVPDTLDGLQQYARSWRGDFELPVVAVTGSNGKTTVKQMLAAILRVRGEVLATAGNLNNHIGVPLTLLGLRAEHRTAVIEMGANHAGEIAALAALARPGIAVVNNAGPAHLEGFGSIEGVARAKGELYESLDENGIAVINADDAWAPLWCTMAGRADVITFGLSDAADVRAIDPQDAPGGGATFILHAAEGRFTIQLPLAGVHNVRNALAAAACALALGLDCRDIAAGLLNVRPAPGRLRWFTAAGGARLLDDSYNANPESLRAGIALLVAQPLRPWLVLGDMGELGERGAELHRAAGEDARQQGIERLYALGPLAGEAARGFGDGAVHFDDLDDLVAELRRRLDQDVAVLVKGSRAARMERVVAALATDADAGGLH